MRQRLQNDRKGLKVSQHDRKGFRLHLVFGTMEIRNIKKRMNGARGDPEHKKKMNGARGHPVHYLCGHLFMDKAVGKRRKPPVGTNATFITLCLVAVALLTLSRFHETLFQIFTTNNFVSAQTTPKFTI